MVTLEITFPNRFCTAYAQIGGSGWFAAVDHPPVVGKASNISYGLYSRRGWAHHILAIGY